MVYNILNSSRQIEQEDQPRCSDIRSLEQTSQNYFTYQSISSGREYQHISTCQRYLINNGHHVSTSVHNKHQSFTAWGKQSCLIYSSILDHQFSTRIRLRSTHYHSVFWVTTCLLQRRNDGLSAFKHNGLGRHVAIPSPEYLMVTDPPLHAHGHPRATRVDQ